MDIKIRKAVKDDCKRMMELVEELALYEKAPEAVTVRLVVPPLQVIAPPADAEALIADGSVTVTGEAVAVQDVLAASLAVTV